MTGGNNDAMSPSGFLLCSAEASECVAYPRLIPFSSLLGAVTALMTNPIWVVKVRMFTTEANAPGAYKTLWRWLQNLWSRLHIY
jgi:solute carrier family 25 folate transporter 32